ncbi:MAG: hypothetical protein IPM29_02530 [Planctomycetes bacterium]|nr:hypothetical protein [Planctomycetota bacterium]
MPTWREAGNVRELLRRLAAVRDTAGLDLQVLLISQLLHVDLVLALLALPGVAWQRRVAVATGAQPRSARRLGAGVRSAAAG